MKTSAACLVLAVTIAACPATESADGEPAGGASAGAAASGSGGSGAAASHAGSTAAHAGSSAGNAGSAASQGGSSAEPGGVCSNDGQCGGGTPSCMHGACVEADVAARWMCPEDTAPAQTASVHYAFNTFDLVTQEPVSGVVAKACTMADADCVQPVASFTETTGSGRVEFDLPSGFRGFIDVQSSNAMQTRVYLTRPLAKDTTGPDLAVFSRLASTGLASSLGAALDPTRGMANLQALDCTGTPAAGVQFTASGALTPFYAVAGVPSAAASVSDASGFGGFLNVELGVQAFTARWGVDGPVLGSFNAQVRADTVTVVNLPF